MFELNLFFIKSVLWGPLFVPLLQFFQAMTSFMEDMRSKIPASNTAPATPQMRVARSFGEYVIQEAALLGPQEFLAFQRVVLDELLRQKEKTQARELQQQKL